MPSEIPDPAAAPTGRALISAIRADPDDVTARLVYADYLDEFTGGPGPRSVLIRSYCLAKERVRDRVRLPHVGTAVSRSTIEQFVELSRVVLNEVYSRFGVDTPHQRLSLDTMTGFVESVRFIGPADWVRLADRLVPFEPVRAVLLDAPPHFEFGKAVLVDRPPARFVFADSEQTDPGYFHSEPSEQISWVTATTDTFHDRPLVRFVGDAKVRLLAGAPGVADRYKIATGDREAAVDMLRWRWREIAEWGYVAYYQLDNDYAGEE